MPFWFDATGLNPTRTPQFQTHYLPVLVDATANETATWMHDLLRNAMKKDVYSMNEMQLTATTSVMKQNAKKNLSVWMSNVQMTSEH
jgi:hypothetical protein